jgi:ribosomal-protein-alanine N-acetyltransferase
MNTGILFGSFRTLSSPRMVLRKILPDDIEEVFAIYSNDSIFKHCGIIRKNNIEVVLKSIGHFERDFKKKARIKWGIALNGSETKIIGIIEAMDFDHKVNKVTIGYFLHPDHWHKGYSTEAVKILVRFLFEEAGVNRIQAEVMPKNIHSKKVLLNNGFLYEGTLRQATLWSGKGIVDLEMYSILASDYQKYIKTSRAQSA